MSNLHYCRVRLHVDASGHVTCDMGSIDDADEMPHIVHVAVASSAMVRDDLIGVTPSGTYSTTARWLAYNHDAILDLPARFRAPR